MNLEIDKNELKARALKPENTMDDVKAALREAVVAGQVGALTVNPESLQVRAYQRECLFVIVSTHTIYQYFEHVCT